MRRNAFLVLLLVIYDSPTYDMTGLRTSKTVNGVVHTYLYSGGKLLRESYPGVTLDFFYDSNGTPYALDYNGTVYYYVTNVQGDVMRLVNANGTVVASYTYDPYGKVTSMTGSLAGINPLRYRGYYYDSETGFYYLQSRYYDPNIGRFINADGLMSTGQGLLGYDMFTYCGNNPVNRFDINGTASTKIEELDLDDDDFEEYGVGGHGGSRGAGRGSNGIFGNSGGVSFNFRGRKNRPYAQERGWTDDLIQRAIQNGVTGTSINRATGNTCSVYSYPGSANQYIVIDDVTRSLVQVSNLKDSGWAPDSDIKWFKTG